MLTENDNVGVVLATQKGRCGSFGLLRILRRTLAYSLACGIRVHMRMVAPELNVADKNSRCRSHDPSKCRGRPVERGQHHKGGGPAPGAKVAQGYGRPRTHALKVVVRGKAEEKSSREGERVWSSLASRSGPEDRAGAEERQGGHKQRLRDEAGQILRVREGLKDMAVYNELTFSTYISSPRRRAQAEDCRFCASEQDAGSHPGRHEGLRNPTCNLQAFNGNNCADF